MSHTNTDAKAGSRFVVPCAVSLAMTLAGACGPSPRLEGPAIAPPPPNVLLVVLDTTRTDALSCYGGPAGATPAIDALAAESTVYRGAYATSFWTLPSHGSMLTGLYPSEAGATSETNHLPEQVTTLAERLAAEGYRTGAVVRNPWLSAERGFAQGFDHYIEGWRDDDGRSEVAGEGAATAAGVDWIGKEFDGVDPFFLFVNLNIAHMPYTPPEEVFRRFASQPWSSARLARLRTIEGGWAHFAGAFPLDDIDFQILRELYSAEVAVADSLVADLLDAVRRQGALDQTLVIVTSDHGENLGEHGMIDHLYSLFDTTVRVPLLIRYPARFAPGVRVDEVVSLVDLVPTVLDTCGMLEADNDADAALLARSLCDGGHGRREAVFAENGRPINGIRLLQRFPDFDVREIDHEMRMIRTEEHKLVWKVGRAAELYDTVADPGETTDLGDVDRELRNRLLDELRLWVAELDTTVRPGRFSSRDRESLQRLRALGYVE
jgi:arylsulfatase A-like enzyme